MPDLDVFALWVQEVKTELKDGKEKHDELRIDFERLQTSVNTRTRIIWALVGTTIAAGAVIIALITLMKDVPT